MYDFAARDTPAHELPVSRPLRRPDWASHAARSAREQPVSLAYSVVRSVVKGTCDQMTFPLSVDPVVHGPVGGRQLHIDRASARFGDIACPFGTVGDTVWIRERWATKLGEPKEITAGRDGTSPIHYEADRPLGWYRWQAPATLPRERSRALLKVKTIRVQRLQEVSDEDVRREDLMGWLLDSVERWPHARDSLFDEWRRYTAITSPMAEIPSLRGLYAKNWDTRLGPGFLDWSHDPLVWVVTFEVRPLVPVGHAAGRS